MNEVPMKLMLPLKYVNEQDKRALWLYVVIALLSAVCLASTLFFTSGFPLGKKTELEHPATSTPKPSSRNR